MDPYRSGSRRIAFFGGSFDPPHLGHLAVARAARAALRLDEVLFAPVGAQPLKPLGATADFQQRAAMISLAIADEAGFSLSLVDAPQAGGKPNYTIDTLLALRAGLVPGSALFCLMGADSFLGLRKWYRAAEIPFVAPLIVAARPGEPLDQLKDALPPELAIQPVPDEQSTASGITVRSFTLTNALGGCTPMYLLPELNVEISASGIRAGVQSALEAQGEQQAGAAGMGVELDWVPAAVRDYIERNRLYR